MTGVVTETKEGLGALKRYWPFFIVVFILLATVGLGWVIRFGNWVYKLPVVGPALAKVGGPTNTAPTA